MTDSTGNPQPSVGTVRIATMISVPLVLEQLGFEPTGTLAEMGFDIRLFDDPDNVITYSLRSRLIQQCVDKTNCRHFGHLVARHIGPSSLGIVGFLMQQSPDVLTALRGLVRHAHLHVSGAEIYLEVRDELAFLGYRIIQSEVEAVEQTQDGVVTVAFNILRKLCGPTWNPTEVCFAHNQPRNTRPLKQYFNAPLSYDTTQNGVYFLSIWLQAPLTGADPDLHLMLQTQIDVLESRYADDFVEQVRRVLHSALLMQQATVGHIADLFCIHPRTLNRRLRACGTCFRELADQSRFEIARQLLENSSISIDKIAATLDYSDASAFARAFRRQSGTTPSLWREQSKLPSPPDR